MDQAARTLGISRNGLAAKLASLGIAPANVTFVAFIGASAHGVASGSDSGTPWAFWIYVIPIAAAVFFLTYRIVVSLSSRIRPRVERAGTTGAPTGPLGPLDRPGARSYLPPTASSDRPVADPIGE